jgi:signal transduction histidine kinase
MPQRLADVHSQVRPSLGELSSQATAALVVPLVFRSRSSGLLVALDRIVGGPQFAAEDERLLSAFAASAATAVATAQTVEAQRLRDSIRAAEEERSRWSRELHDETLQGLGALQVLLSTADRRPGGPAAAISDAREQIEEEIERLQVLITNLRPAALDDIGLVPAVAGVIRRARALYGFEASLDVELGDALGPTDSRLAPEIESTIYRLVQEAVNNAGKHANADAVDVRIVERPQRVAIEVRDDGVGFDTRATKLGFGLIGMKERLSLVEGSLELRSAPGQGTTVLASVPIRRADLFSARDERAS